MLMLDLVRVAMMQVGIVRMLVHEPWVPVLVGMRLASVPMKMVLVRMMPVVDMRVAVF